MHSYKSYVVEMSLYYGLLVLVLPLIYAVTNHLSFLSVFRIEWFAISFFLYPGVLLLSAIRYGLHRSKKPS